MKTARRLGVSIASSAAVALCFFSVFAKSGLTQESPRKDYSDKVSATYNYRFGKELPFAPGNPQIEGNEFIQPGAFPDATYCAHCHQEAYHQWRQALHSNSFREPFYRTSVNLLIKTKGIEYSRHCDSCHNPIGVLSGGLTQNSQVDRKFDQNGLTCTVCHSIQAVRSTSGNGGFVMGVPSVMVDEKGNRIPGEVPYSEIMSHTDRHVRAVMKDLYRTPEFCAACHKANLPEHLNDFKFISAFTTFDEWQNSKFSHRNPLTFYSGDFKTCQACHMMRAPNTLPDYGAKHGTFASHSWTAGNTAAPFYYGFDEQLEKTVRFLQTGNYLNVDIFGLKKANTETLIAPLGSVPFSIGPNDVLDVYVVIQNKNIGHSLIPEVRDLYEAWVEFTVKDASGKDIYHSGFLKPDGSLDERAHSFTNRPVDKDGEFVDNHQVQLIHSVAYDNTIAAGRSTIVRYQFRVPSNISGPITITAKVNYRHLRQSYLNNVLGKDHPAYPVVQLATRSRTLNIGENQPEKPDANDNPDWMRWNNLGIGYLDALQYSSAVQAFGEVVKLRPDYADAYTNIAVTEIPWEKYESAWDNIQKSLSLSPNNARALYYAALLERRASHPKEELDDLLEVVRQYPQSRDARRDLGITYYRQGNYHEAMTQFEALQAIDPDDLSAHYNLSILYHRMGMIKQAKEQQALFVTEKINSNARTYSLGYLRSHPEISTESIPWHLHTDLADVTNGFTQTAQK
ncbi:MULTISPECIES: tetratricopeptide repeat protein [Acidobacteriaceae]|uniref:tetratricopeptide repeat protein n=1 Tax=Acidobacteriaceae TaxID=204434 RepID=UPI00131C9006|nr:MULTISPECIES: tetratricopeptide repeat protein [Acidobacteriaceae]MDW5264792.1 tetratricopeptide repeat protein [Edaphobacter sp.]